MLLKKHGIAYIIAADLSEVIPKDVGERPLRMVRQEEDRVACLLGFVRWIQSAIDGGGRVLVHSPGVSEAAIIVCA